MPQPTKPPRPGHYDRAIDVEAVLLALWCFVVAFAGGLVGLVLGNIRLPLVVLVATTPAAGAGANIGISGVAAGPAPGPPNPPPPAHRRPLGGEAPPASRGGC